MKNRHLTIGHINRRKSLLLVYAVFVLIVLFEPAYIRYNIPFLHILFRITKYLIAVFVIFMFIIRKVKLNGLLIGTSIFEGLLLLSTFVNGSAVEVWVTECAYIIILVLFIQTIMEIDVHTLPLAFSVVLGTYTHINTICRLMYPTGMFTIDTMGFRSCWFLGYDNASCICLILAITVALFRIFYYKTRFMVWDWSVIISGCWFILIQEIATGIVAGILFFAFVLIFKNERFLERLPKAKLVVIGMFILFFLIQFATALLSENLSFVFTLLGKNGTFTGRLGAWLTTWREIQKGSWLCWLLGKGQQTSDTYIRLLGGRVFVNPHSYYLQVIYEGGILAFAVLAGLLIYVAARFDKRKYSHTYITFLAGLLAIMLMWQTEAYTDLVKYGFIILSFMYNTPLLVKSEKASDKKQIRFRLNKQEMNKVF